MRLDHLQKQIEDTRKRKKLWPQVFDVLFKRTNSRLLEYFLERTVNGDKLSIICNDLNIPYYNMVYYLRNNEDIRLIIKRARKHRAVDQRENIIKELTTNK